MLPQSSITAGPLLACFSVVAWRSSLWLRWAHYHALIARCGPLHCPILLLPCRGVFDRAKAAADGHLVLFNSLRHVSFTYELPTEAELRRLIRMCPLLSSLELGTGSDNAHALNLSRIIAADFPHIQCTISLLPSSQDEYSLIDVAAKLGCAIDKY